MIRLHLFKPGDLAGSAVALVTGSAFCHVAIEVDDVVWEATREGHRKVPLAEYGVTSDLTIVVPPLSGAPGVQGFIETRVVEALDARLGDRYGYLDAFFGGLYDVVGATWGRLAISDDNASDCSHYAAEALIRGGYDLPDPGTITPGDLARFFGGEVPCRSFGERLKRAFPQFA
jgi:hypothetical protein